MSVLVDDWGKYVRRDRCVVDRYVRYTPLRADESCATRYIMLLSVAAMAAVRVTTPTSLPLPPDATSHWLLSMRRLARSHNPVHGGGFFYTDSLGSPTCLLQVKPQDGGAVRLQLGAWCDDPASVMVRATYEKHFI